VIGFSVYLNDELSQTKLDQLTAFKQAGFTGVFTSLHIPEDDVAKYLPRLKRLGAACQQLSLQLTADVSAAGMTRLGLDIEDTNAITQLGVTGLRIDDGIEMAVVARLSQQLPIALNASTITSANIATLKANQADFDHLEAWHNYYPRPETGLDEAWLVDKNRWLRAQGFKTMAFVAGDAQRRGPLAAGLPTLEVDRYQSPLAATLRLMAQDDVDQVYLGDPGLSAHSRLQFQQYFQQHNLALMIKTNQDWLLQQVWHQRLDVARDVVRLVEGRQQFQQVAPASLMTRAVGAITLDNNDYGRYVGELQLVKRPLGADQRVNVIGQVCQEDLALLPLIAGGQAIKFIKEADANGFG